MSHQTWRKIFIPALFFLFVFPFCFTLTTDPDWGFHLRYGEMVVREKKISTTDVFSFTYAGSGENGLNGERFWPWGGAKTPTVVDAEWLWNGLFYLIYERWLFLGVAIVSSLFNTVTVCLPLIFLPGSFLTKTIIAIWAVIGLRPFFESGARPQNFGWFFFSLTLFLLLKYRQKNWVLYLLPLPFLFFFWVNIHPSFYLGLFLIAFFTFSEVGNLFIRYSAGEKPPVGSGSRVVVIYFACLVLSLVFSQLRFPLNVRSGPSLEVAKALFLPVDIAAESSLVGTVRTNISEWLPPILINLPGLAFLLAMVFSVATFGFKKISLPFWQSNLLLLLVIIYFAALSRRNIPYFFLVFIPLMLPTVEFLNTGLKKIRLYRFLEFSAAIFLIAAALVSFYLNAGKILKNNSFESKAYCLTAKYPCGAIEFIRKNKLTGNMLNFYNWGGYLIWHLREHPVFIDGRVPGTEVHADYHRFAMLEEGWEKVLEDYKIDWILFYPSRTIEESLTKSGKWKKIYADDIAVIFQRS